MATRKKVFVGKCTNFYKQLSVAEFYVEAVPELDATAELLVTGETTGAYELTAQGMRDADGYPAERIQQGQFFSLKTDRLIHRGDKLYQLKIEN